MSFTDVFGGDTLYPADLSYRAIALSANTTLQWPTEASAQTNLVAAIMDVTASAGSLVIKMPPATEVSTGTAVVFNNVGSTTFTVNDNGGNLLLTVASGLIWTAYVTSNATAAGTWDTFQNGAGTSSASAASLAGYGIKAITTTLNQSMPVTSTAVDFTADATYRAGVYVWTGGTGVASLTAPATLGNDWFTNIKNSGTGNLVLTPLAGTIDSSTTVTLGPDESAIIVTNGTNFFTIGLTPIPVPGFDYTTVAVAGTGNYTLSGTELGRISYSFTGILTGNRTIIVPTTVQQYWPTNNTTGAYTLTVKTSAGTGIAVPAGTSLLLYCDGVNVLDATTGRVATAVPASTGTNTVAVAAVPFGNAYYSGARITFVAGGTNTGATTLNINSIGALAVQKRGVALAAGDITTGNVVTCVYDGTQWQIISPTVALNRAQTYTAIQTFSSGIAFANETLATYDEGTWTPAYTFGSGSTTYTVQAGGYIQVGKVMTISGRIQTTTVSAPSGTLSIGTLPAAVPNSNNNVAFCGMVPISWAAGLTTNLAGAFEPGTSTITLKKQSATTGYGTDPGGDLANSANLRFGGTYLLS